MGEVSDKEPEPEPVTPSTSGPSEVELVHALDKGEGPAPLGAPM